jgi:TonB family protein
MSRLYKKCFIASGGLHLLLAAILITCPAFLASNPKQSEVQLITFIPDLLTDGPFTGGGNPNAGRTPSPAPAPPTPTPPTPVAPAPPPPAPPQPRPQVREVAPPKTAEESLEPAKDTRPTRRKPEVSITPVVRNPNAKATAKDTSAEDSQARAQLAMRNRIVGALDRSLVNIRSGTGGAAKTEGSPGPGGGGPSYAPYEAWVLKVYDDAWVAPDDAISEDATVKVSVTIASDGTVTAKKIVKRSGDAAVDASVQRTLDRVTTMGRPFPEGSKDKERTYIIPFNMKTKRGTA